MAARLSRLSTLVVAGLTAGLLFSPKLWVSTRIYPLTPAVAFLAPISYPFDYAVYALLLLLLTAVAIAPQPRWWIGASLLLLAGLCAQDQSRLQPWVYQYAFMLMACALAKSQNIARLIIVAIYFWSGAQKLNPYFAGETFTWLAAPFATHFPALVIAAGRLAPFIEMLGGIGLLARKFRDVAVIGLITMHLGILLAIGPLGHNSNVVVWPWNIAMIMFLLLLFRKSDVAAPEILWGGGWFHRLVFGLFALAPALSFVNLWDSYLSASLYSGNRNQGAISMAAVVAERLPDGVSDDFEDENDGREKLLINDWSFDELNVPAYPEIRIYKNVARSLCKFVGKPADVKLEVEGKAALANRTVRTVFTCSELTGRQFNGQRTKPW